MVSKIIRTTVKNQPLVVYKANTSILADLTDSAGAPIVNDGSLMVSDHRGRFSLYADPGSYDVYFIGINYRGTRVTLSENDEIEVAAGGASLTPQQSANVNAVPNIDIADNGDGTYTFTDSTGQPTIIQAEEIEESNGPLSGAVQTGKKLGINTVNGDRYYPSGGAWKIHTATTVTPFDPSALNTKDSELETNITSLTGRVTTLENAPTDDDSALEGRIQTVEDALTANPPHDGVAQDNRLTTLEAHDHTQLHDGAAQDTAIAQRELLANKQAVVRATGVATDTGYASEKAVRDAIDAITFTGDYKGSAATVAGLPVGRNGDWAILHTDDGPSEAGLWVTDGTTYTLAMEVPDLLTLSLAQITSIAGAQHTEVGLVNAQLLDAWGVSRRRRRVFNTGVNFDFAALGYADRTAVFVRNTDNANGIGVTYGTGGTTNLEITRASGITQAIPGQDSFNIQPSEIAVVEKDGSTVYVSIFPGERVKNFDDYAAANAFGALPHDGIVVIKATQEVWARKSITNGIAFPADGVENNDWGIFGGSTPDPTPQVVNAIALSFRPVTNATVDSEVIVLFPYGRWAWNPTSTTDSDGVDWVTPNTITEPAPGRWARIGQESSFDAAAAWDTDREYRLENNEVFFWQQPATVTAGEFITKDGVTLEAGRGYNLIYDEEQSAAGSVAAIADDQATIDEVAKMNYVGAKPLTGNDDWVPVPNGGDFPVSEVSYQLLTTDTGVEPTLTAGQWFSFVRPDADGKEIATYRFHNGTEVKTIETGTNELAVVRYTADGAIQDFDHKAILETGAVNMTLSASTVGRVIQMVSEGPTTVVTADGTEQFTGSQGVSTDSKLTLNESFRWATIIGRTAGGWSQYVGQAGIPDGVDISTPTTFKAATRLVQNGVENSASVTFPTPFKTGTIPSVLPAPFAPGDNQSVTLQSVDHLGFTVWVVRNESDVGIASPTIHWSAMGEPA